ncbi:hypothetical protein [Streptomyces sp. SLBN-115]|uniref:hypothetical protein n=1 Tax=Streptomyces sp. SLBN-115 TaxID=2768453 RepID=UPI0011524793|nr:hypothetical protein [Streptomyces sp. SLBN-115]TQJ54521.1 hypothetical protein FBY34_2298 [Streptomyces sp. SLBN-115]
MHPRNALSRRIRKAGVAARAGLFVVLALIALTLAAPSAAYADFACNFTGDESYHMDSPGSNGESIMPAVVQWKDGGGSENLGDQKGTVNGAFKVEAGQAQHYTLYELNGMRGLNWSMTFKGKGDAAEKNGSWGSGADSCQVMAYVNNGIADAVFYGTKVLTRFSISIKEMASNPSPFSGLYTGRDNVVTTLRDNVLKPAVAVMILLVGLWVFTKWRKGDMREVWAGVSWTALTVIAVMAFLTGNNYDKVVENSDKWIGDANSALSSTVLAGVSGKMQSPCDLPNNGKDEPGQVGLRLSSCAIYDTLAFRPWAMGQFGETGANCVFRKDSGSEVSEVDGTCTFKGKTNYDCYWGQKDGARCGDLRVRQAVAQSWTNVDSQRGEAKPDGDKFDDWEKIRIEIAGGEKTPDEKIYPVAFNDWAGKNATDRVGIAFYSLVAAFIVGVMVLALSALTLLWHAVTLILVMLLPLVATLGIHPSQQKLLKSWLETFIHSFVLRAGFGVILTVLLVLYQMILPAQIALGTQLLMLLLVTVAVVMMLKKLLAGNFTPQVAGGEDALGIRDGANATFDKAAAMAPGLAIGSARTTGRVAGTTAKGTARATGSAARGGAWALDKFANKGRGRAALQKRGWLGQSKREQQQTAYRSAEAAREAQARNRPSEEQEAQSPPAPKRGRRVSDSGGKQVPQQAVPPTESRPAPAPQPQPAAPRPRPVPVEAPPAPRPQTPSAPRPQTPPAAPPPPRDPRGPSGRV